MWQLFLQQLARDIQRQTLKQGGVWGPRVIGLASIGGLNKPEAYADRINREFNLRNYAKAWDIYDSNRAYWEKLYGDDPVTSRNHPAGGIARRFGGVSPAMAQGVHGAVRRALSRVLVEEAPSQLLVQGARE